jgi:hypothetical protein
MCFSDSRFQLFSSQVRKLLLGLLKPLLKRFIKLFPLHWKDINKKDCIQRVAEEWRSLSSKERAEWDEVAREDKLR